MNEHCMPGSTFETRPLYTLPTTPRWRSRSTKISAARSSSRMATIVSWPLEEMIISLVITRTPGAGRAGQAGWAGWKNAFLSFLPIPPLLPLLPSSVREPAHAHVEYEAEARERRYHRRPAVTHQRQCQPFDGRQPSRHGDVVDHLKAEAGKHAEHKVRAEAIFSQTGRLERAQDHE